MQHKQIRYGFLLAVCILAVVTSGCQEDVVAVNQTERPFSLYGVLRPTADTQFVRVSAVQGRLEPTPPEPLDARFVSINAETGEERVWQDSVLSDPNERYSHVFWAPFRVAYGQTYRLEVESADGLSTRSEVEVPLRGQVVKKGPDCSRLPVEWQGPTVRLLNVRVTYDVQYRPGPLPFTTQQFTLPYGTYEADEGWRLDVDIGADYSALRDTLEALGQWNEEHGIALAEVALKVDVVDPAWDPPGEGFDPEVLVQPDVFSNVENGFGFVGAGYRKKLTWEPTPALLQATRFTRVQENR